MYSLFDLCLFLLLPAGIYYWWRGQELHSVALRAARKYCREREIQLLDETLVFQKFAMTRASNNRRYFSRIYQFDYCPDGEERFEGEIILRGNRVLRIMLKGEQLEITEY